MSVNGRAKTLALDLKTLAASALAAVESGDVETIYSLVVIALRELKQKTELTPIAVETALDELVAEGYAIVYEEATLDFKRKYKKYMATDKIAAIAKPLPPTAQRVASMKYVTPQFYLLLNQA